ncbi:unnamed protein product [Paramecium octaurelia]|uniref:Uncharacterized protein n=1 Tax=Paramecium octaurelia TaxID=43137 RepID=A0A8S1XCD8_PAROT|nr:unnamed protein product [Paramecium octaurelia]
MRRCTLCLGLLITSAKLPFPNFFPIVYLVLRLVQIQYFLRS